MKKRPLIYNGFTTNKEFKYSQDYSGRYYGKYSSGVVVADGLGSAKFSEIASKYCTEEFLNAVHEIEIFEIDNINSVFEFVWNSLIAEFSKFCRENQLELNPETTFATTLIAAIQNSKENVFCYVGNGSAWHIKGNFNTFNKKSQFLPWNALNVLNPHTIQNKEGKEALFRLLSPSVNQKKITPSVVKISKDSEYGDILVVCTDGIYSYDQIEMGSSRDQIWIQAGKQMSLLWEYFEKFFSQEDYTNESLKICLEDYLSVLKEKKLIDDDATLGVVISPEVLEYQNKRRNTL